jgi:hypothetical protein
MEPLLWSSCKALNSSNNALTVGPLPYTSNSLNISVRGSSTIFSFWQFFVVFFFDKKFGHNSIIVHHYHHDILFFKNYIS